jgi:hypothetical protein
MIPPRTTTRPEYLVFSRSNLWLPVKHRWFGIGEGQWIPWWAIIPRAILRRLEWRRK